MQRIWQRWRAIRPNSRASPHRQRWEAKRKQQFPSCKENDKLETEQISRDDSIARGAMDQSKKTMRHFYCRDVLWETFEQMANDFDCSIDYLINEAMRFYARSKNFQAGTASSQNLPQQAAGGMPMGGGNGSM